MTLRLSALLLLSVAMICLLGADAATQPASERTTESGLKIVEVAASPEPGAKAGDKVWVLYAGRLQSNGKEFDSSARHGNDPISFKLGNGQVIKGWDEGIAGMKVGDKRQLIIPANLAYGDRGAGQDIPPGATLVFDVELTGMVRAGR
jgi:peptidylprolyl isomerase